MKYRKIKKEDILILLKKEGRLPANFIIEHLQTSVYQVGKYLRELSRDGKVCTKYIGGGTICSIPNESDPESYCDFSPPLKVWEIIN